MTIVIEDEELADRVAKVAAQRGESVSVVIQQCLRDGISETSKASKGRPGLQESRAAMKRVQEAYRLHGNPDCRSHDEIIGYNDLGHFDDGA